MVDGGAASSSVVMEASSFGCDSPTLSVASSGMSTAAAGLAACSCATDAADTAATTGGSTAGVPASGGSMAGIAASSASSEAGTSASGLLTDPLCYRSSKPKTPRKKCEHCGALAPTAKKVCDGCGARFEVKEKDETSRKRSSFGWWA